MTGTAWLSPPPRARRPAGQVAVAAPVSRFATENGWISIVASDAAEQSAKVLKSRVAPDWFRTHENHTRPTSPSWRSRVKSCGPPNCRT